MISRFLILSGVLDKTEDSVILKLPKAPRQAVWPQVTWKFLEYLRNRHFAEWRFLPLIRIVTVNPKIWNVSVIGINIPPFGRGQTARRCVGAFGAQKNQFYFNKAYIFCQLPSEQRSSGGFLFGLPKHWRALFLTFFLASPRKKVWQRKREPGGFRFPPGPLKRPRQAPLGFSWIFFPLRISFEQYSEFPARAGAEGQKKGTPEGAPSFALSFSEEISNYRLLGFASKT